MSLVVRISVNESPLFWVTARRTFGTDDPGSVNRYEVQRIDLAKHEATTLGVLEHRYGDGAAALAHAALGMIVCVRDADRPP